MQSSLFRSLLANWIGLAAAVLVGFFLSPFVVHRLGTELYGIWSLIVSTAAQLIILDLGIRHAVVKYIAEAGARKSEEEISKILSSAQVVLLALGLLGFAALFALSFRFTDWFQIPPAYAQVAMFALMLAALDAAIELVFGTFQGALIGAERYDVAHGINTARIVMNAVLVVVFLSAGYGLVALAACSLSTRFLQRILLSRWTYRQFPGLVITPRLVERRQVRRILQYGFWVSLVTIAGRIIFQTDTLIVGYFLGPSAVTTYAIALILIEQFRMFAQNSTTIFVPRFSLLQERGAGEAMSLLLQKSTRYSLLLSIAMGVPLLTTGDDFIALWMGEQYVPSAEIVALLTLPFFVTVPSGVFRSWLLGVGHQRLAAKLLSAEAVVNLILSIVLVRWFGIHGVAWGTVVPSVVFSGFLLPWAALRLQEGSFRSYVRGLLSSLVPLFLGHYALLQILATLLNARTWLGFLLTNGVGLLLLVAVTYWGIFDHEDREYVRRRFGPTGTRGS